MFNKRFLQINNNLKKTITVANRLFQKIKYVNGQ